MYSQVEGTSWPISIYLERPGSFAGEKGSFDKVKFAGRRVHYGQFSRANFIGLFCGGIGLFCGDMGSFDTPKFAGGRAHHGQFLHVLHRFCK